MLGQDTDCLPVRPPSVWQVGQKYEPRFYIPLSGMSAIEECHWNMTCAMMRLRTPVWKAKGGGLELRNFNQSELCTNASKHFSTPLEIDSSTNGRAYSTELKYYMPSIQSFFRLRAGWRYKSVGISFQSRTEFSCIRYHSNSPGTRREHPQSHAMEDITATLNSLGLSDVPSFENTYPARNLIDIYRSHLTHLIADITKADPKIVQSSLQWTQTMDKGDLVLPVPALRLKSKPNVVAQEIIDKVHHKSSWASNIIIHTLKLLSLKCLRLFSFRNRLW